MNILVTGAKGFVGRNLCENLKNIRDGKNRTRPALTVDEIYEYDLDTDPALLDATGGVIQGMSGAPVFQNGRIVGAVTHVFVNDPTKGYGIFIENMLAQKFS